MKNFKISIFTLIVVLQAFRAFSSPSPSAAFSPHLFYAENIEKGAIHIIEESIKHLKRNRTGRELLQEISSRLSSAHRHILIQPTSEGHAFKDPLSLDQPFVIEINFDKTKEAHGVSRIGAPGPRCDRNSRFYEIGSIDSPFHITLGHELIHLFHYLEDPAEYKDYVLRFDNRLWEIYPDDRYPQRMWKSLEEQRTVIGLPEIPLDQQLTEDSLLLAEGLAPRYAYQPRENNFFEENSIIDFVFNSRISPAGHFSTLIRRGWEFDEETAIASDFNAQEFKKLYSKDISGIKARREEQVRALAHQHLQPATAPIPDRFRKKK